MRTDFSSPPNSHAAYDDYEYVWRLGEIEIGVPYWIADLFENRHLGVFLLGAFSGVLVSVLAVLIGFYSAVN